MDVTSTGSQLRDSRPDEQNARGPEATTVTPKLPTWQQTVLAIREEDKTPTVRLLLAVIEELSQLIGEQSRQIHTLEEEIARLNGHKQKPRSNSKPSALSNPPKPAPADGKRPGSAKRSKTSELTIHHEHPVPPKDLPPGSTFLHHAPFVVQDLVITPWNTRYLLEIWRTPDGKEVRGELPAGVHGHFGSGLIGFVLQQHFAAHVPQPRILNELHDFGIDISSGQINNILTEKHEVFHAEKDALLPAGLQSPCVIVDDSGAPHNGKYGSCLCISNDFFTSFHSSDTKQRSKFLDVLRCGHSDYVLTDIAWSYLEKQGLPAKVSGLLESHVQRTFADSETWNQHLDVLEITSEKHRQTVTEAALLGSVVAHGVAPELGIVSDGAGQYAMFVHGLCWIHQERNLAKLVPCGTEQCQAHKEVLTAFWELYAELKAYRLSPSPSQVEILKASFDKIVDRTTCFPELNAMLERMAGNKDDLLRVLERPDLPLHTNTVERDFRDWATKRKVSSGTRSKSGRRVRDTFLSLKSTCRKLGIRFWDYLQDRLEGAGKIPVLAELVGQKATGPAPI